MQAWQHYMDNSIHTCTRRMYMDMDMDMDMCIHVHTCGVCMCIYYGKV